MLQEYRNNVRFRWAKLLTLLLLMPALGWGQVVISQVYGGGGNAGAVYTNDFIELFNRGTTAVNVTGWTVQYASATGTFTAGNSTALSGTIQPGKYYLVQEAAGTAGTTALPTPDAAGTIAMGATSFKVALVNNGTPATAGNGPGSVFSTNVVDFVGVGTANAYEGATAGPALSNTTAGLRNSSGCNDTNNNGADFTAGTAMPRNSGTAAFSCVAPACAAPGTPGFASITSTSASVSFTPDATNTGPYTITATPTTGTTVTATGNGSPISLTGLAPGTSYSVTVTATCTVASGGGSSAASAAATLTTPAAAPTLTSIDPSSIAAGQATTVTFTGTGFVSGATVNFNGSSVATTFVSSTSLTASIAAPASGTTTTFPVSVTTPSGTSGTQTLTVTGVSALTPISIAAVNTAYTENFDGLAATGTGDKSTLPVGFNFEETGAGANATYTAGTGSGSSGDTYSFGTSATPERALGTLLSNSVSSTIGAAYTNNSGAPITSLLIRYTGEQWRLGDNSRSIPDRLDFQYSTTATGIGSGTFMDVDALDFTAPVTAGATGALDGNAAANRTVVSATITGLSIPAGATFYLRWTDFNASGSDDGLAVDDFSLTANPMVVCTAPTNVAAGSITATSASISFTGDASASSGYTATATPTAGGTAISNTGAASPIGLTGLSNSTQYNVTVTSNCASGATATSSPAVGFTTLAAPLNPEINVRVGATDYLTGSTYAFGSTVVGTAVGPVTFTIQNTSATDVLTVSGAGVTGSAGAGFSLSAAATPFTVSPNSSVTFTASFNPTSSGAKTGVITISSNDQDEASYLINLTGTATAAPVLTSIAPASIMAGQTTTVTFTGTGFVSGATVNFNGGSVATAFGSSTSLTADIAAPASGTTATFPVSVTTPSGTSGTQTLTVTGTPTGFFEPFEAGSKGSYPTGTVTLTTGDYVFDDALIGASATDLKNGAKSARVRQGSVTMGFDKANGAGVITVQAANFSSDTGGQLVVSVSNDGGATFAAYTSPATALTSTLQAYTFTANVAGNVRIRLQNTAASGVRINLDDLQIADYVPACTAPTALSAGSITSSSATVSFTGSASATGYTVTTSPATTTQMRPANATSVSFTSLAAGTAYTVSIVSNCAGGATAGPATVGFTTLAATPDPLIAVSQGGTGIANGGTYSGFASTSQGSTSAAVMFTIANASTTSALTLGTFALTGPFALSGAAPTSVAANGSATFSLTFTPTTTGTNTGTLTIPNNSQANNPYVVNLSGQGTAPAPTDLVVTTGTLTSPTPIAGNYNNVTITGTGVAILAGPLTAAGAFTIQAGGVLAQNCQALAGAGSFSLQAGGTFVICDAAGIAPTGVSSGAVLLAGTRTYSSLANYIYNGTAAQTTGPGLPGTVLAVGVQNASGLTLSQALSLTQGLNLNQGNLNTGGFPFTLLSSAAGTAGVVNTGGVVVGTATMQRYIGSSNAIGYRHYAAPVSNTTVDDLAAPGFAPVFNTSYNASATPGSVTPFPTVFRYDETRLATVTSNYNAFDKGWLSPAAGEPMLVSRGYSANVPNSALVDFVGTLNNGNQSSGPLTRGTDPQAGWQLLGNPYPSPLDWSTVDATQRPGMDAAMYVFQSSGQYGGSYRSYANGVGGASPLIVAGSGYFARVSTPGTAGAVNLTNANRVTTAVAQPVFGRGTADTRPRLHLTLAGPAGLDEAFVYFEAGATAAHDVEYDATKLTNPNGLNLASLAGAEAMAINALPAPGNAPLLVPLSVGVPTVGSYALQAAEVAGFAGTVTLMDALTGTRTVLATGSRYAFTLSAFTAPGRFTLEFRPAGVLAATSAQALAAQVQLFPNPASASFRVQLPLLSGNVPVQATLSNALGQTVLSRPLSAPAGQRIDAEFDVRALAAGIYSLRLNVAGTQVVRKVIVE